MMDYFTDIDCQCRGYKLVKYRDRQGDNVLECHACKQKFKVHFQQFIEARLERDEPMDADYKNKILIELTT